MSTNALNTTPPLKVLTLGKARVGASVQSRHLGVKATRDGIRIGKILEVYQGCNPTIKIKFKDAEFSSHLCLRDLYILS
jgi:hypothetical protein